MNKSKVLTALVLIIYVLFVFFEFNGNRTLAYGFNAIILSIIAVTYIIFIKQKTVFFSLFLFCYAVSDFLGLAVHYLPYKDLDRLLKIDYYVGNILYILAYVFLLIEMGRTMNIVHVIKNYKIHVLVLTALNVYLVYVLQIIVEPYIGKYYEYYLELVYNIVMLLLLSVALLNYFYKDNKKSLYLFIGSLCIVFAEVIDVAYIYIAQQSMLNFLSTTLTVVAFYFFYLQTKLSDEKEGEIHLYDNGIIN